ncbi:hypothetical protein NDU88_006396 [Pleurodeles waltl]|uniref:Uncharacterized protein n=1 Tax=Pleurodeles waltl TaxID=8319 RepID=A0AAV7VRA2_PLEWA|nr:hypothetical protein NDU88_006396 [Pleurodeles waltl]
MDIRKRNVGPDCVELVDQAVDQAHSCTPINQLPSSAVMAKPSAKRKRQSGRLTMKESSYFITCSNTKPQDGNNISKLELNDLIKAVVSDLLLQVKETVETCLIPMKNKLKLIEAKIADLAPVSTTVTPAMSSGCSGLFATSCPNARDPAG